LRKKKSSIRQAAGPVYSSRKARLTLSLIRIRKKSRARLRSFPFDIMKISPHSVEFPKARPLSSRVVRAGDLRRDKASMKPSRTGRAKRKRPRFTPRGKFKRKRILDAAARVLARRGYGGAQMSEIAEEAGTQSGSLYYHFESREELIEQVLHQGVTSAFAHTRGVVDALPVRVSPRERLEAAVRAHLRFQLVESDYARAAVRSIGQYPEDMWARVNAEFRAYGKFFDGLIVGAIQAGQIDLAVDKSALRMLILGAANWAPEWYRSDGSSSADEIADLLVRLVVRGVCEPGAQDTQGTKTRSQELSSRRERVPRLSRRKRAIVKEA
jgi:AcrR family transcriptional regulator